MASLLLGSLDLTAGPYEAQVGSSMGSWASITTALTSLFLDGSVVSGEATANRQITLQVFVNAATQAALTAACEALIGEANQLSNTLTWTPDGGVPVVYEVFRAAGPVQTDAAGEFQLYHIYQLTLPALPFARSSVRQTPTAAAVSQYLETFETQNFSGVVLGQKPQAAGIGGDIWYGVPAAYTFTILSAFYGATSMNATMTAVTNCTLTYPAATSWPGRGVKTAAKMVATASGLVEMRSTTAVALGALDFVTVAVNLVTSGSPVPFTVGVEWLTAGGATIRTDWGVTSTVGDRSLPGSYWATSRRPATATQVRARFQMPPTTATGNEADLVEMMILATATDAVGVRDISPFGDPTQNAHDGTYGLPIGSYNGGYVYETLPASVNISAASLITLWLTGFNGYKLSLRLFDSGGRWTRWTMTPFAAANGAWVQPTALLAVPDSSCAAGPVNLAQIVAWDLDMYGAGAGGATGIDSLAVGPLPGPTSSPRGNVMALGPILGSARTTAAVTVSAGSPLTDWLVAAIDGTDGPPLLTVTANVATVAAPAGFDGVYSVLGCLAPSAALATPTCTVVQLNAGVTVATRVLTGTTRTGNRYVDFGAVELPLVATPPENLGVSYTFTLAPSSASWVEVLVIDVDASLAWVDNLVTALPVGWVDEPDIVAGLGKVWVGTATDRSDARALALPPTMSRPLQVKAPSTRLLIYSTTIAPNVSLTYWPRWLVEPS